MSITEARDYIEEGINEGYWNEQQFIDMSDNEIIEFATIEQEKAEALTSYRDQNLEGR
jgi:hypothetical protein